MQMVKILEAFIQCFTPQILFLLLLGTIIGYFVGAMPGIGVPVGVALILPFTYMMRPEMALVLMSTIFMSAEYANAIPAVTINTPGTTGAIATCFDGYPMAQKGKLREAISYSLNASVIGGVLGILTLVFISVPIVKLAIMFGSAEYFAIGMLGIVLVVSMRGKESIKGFISACFGFWLSIIGLDMLTGQIRFTFGIPHLMDGLSLPAVFIGLLAFPELIRGIENWKQEEESEKGSNKIVTDFSSTDRFIPLREMWKYRMTIVRAGLIGTFIGAVPGTGASIANLFAYEMEKKVSKYPEKFGTGIPEGVIAAETANNAVVGSSLIPLLTLGIPGSNTGAIMLMVFMMHQIVPGPQLFTRNAILVYVLYIGLFLSVLLMWGVGRVTLPYIGLFKKVPYSYLVPVVIILCFIGSYSLHLSVYDAYLSFGLGVLGYFMRQWGFAPAPAVIGLVLGKMIEVNFRRAILSGYGTYKLFYTRPIALLFLALVLIGLGFSITHDLRLKFNQGKK